MKEDFHHEIWAIKAVVKRHQVNQKKKINPTSKSRKLKWVQDRSQGLGPCERLEINETTRD